MRTSKEGEWFVTTPVIIGSAADLDIACRCNHATFAELSRAILEGQLAIHEKCLNCVACRVRYRTATAEERAVRP
jgi:hypothetical protein